VRRTFDIANKQNDGAPLHQILYSKYLSDYYYLAMKSSQYQDFGKSLKLTWLEIALEHAACVLRILYIPSVFWPGDQTLWRTLETL